MQPHRRSAEPVALACSAVNRVSRALSWLTAGVCSPSHSESAVTSVTLVLQRSRLTGAVRTAKPRLMVARSRIPSL